MIESRTYVPALDGIRAIAALAVVGFHARWEGALGGFIGVDVFFVLSGFLITTLLRADVEGGGLDFRGFLVRRMHRLWPALLVVTLAVGLIGELIWQDFRAAEEILLSVLYLSDYSKALFNTPDVMQHSWSLSVEAQFYLLWPVFIYATRHLSRRQILTLLVIMYLVATGWRFWSIHGLADWQHVYYRADTRASGLILGGLIALGRGSVPASSNLTGVLALLVLAAATFMFRWQSPTSLSFGVLIAEFGASVLILSVLNPKDFLQPVLSSKIMVSVGLYSYSLYLWHYPVIRLLREQNLHGTWMLVGALVISLPLAALTYYLVEKPVMRWSKAGAARAATSR